MSDTVTVEYMYNLRVCSSDDLFDFFSEQLGEDNPSEDEKIDKKEAYKFINKWCATIEYTDPFVIWHNTVDAQYLYNLREEFNFCSGEELFHFFTKQLGEPCPSGYRRIDKMEAYNFINKMCDIFERNNKHPFEMWFCRPVIHVIPSCRKIINGVNIYCTRNGEVLRHNKLPYGEQSIPFSEFDIIIDDFNE